jgi:hypothetical protein
MQDLSAVIRPFTLTLGEEKESVKFIFADTELARKFFDELTKIKLSYEFGENIFNISTIFLKGKYNSTVEITNEVYDFMLSIFKYAKEDKEQPYKRIILTYECEDFFKMTEFFGNLKRIIKIEMHQFSFPKVTKENKEKYTFELNLENYPQFSFFAKYFFLSPSRQDIERGILYLHDLIKTNPPLSSPIHVSYNTASPESVKNPVKDISPSFSFFSDIQKFEKGRFNNYVNINVNEEENPSSEEDGLKYKN